MSHAFVERAEEAPSRGHEDDHAPARLKQGVHAAQRGDVVTRVLEDIDAHDGVEAVTSEIEGLIGVEVELLDDDSRLATKSVSQSIDVRRLLVGRDDQFATIQKAGHRSGSRADFEN